MELFSKEKLGREFPMAEKFLYFASASTGIVPEVALRAQENFIDLYRNSELFHDPETFRMMARLRANIEKLIGAQPGEIALMTNTSDGINSIASAVDWAEGDEVLIGNREFPANTYPWQNQKRQGVEIKWLAMDEYRLTPELIEEAIGPKTRLLAISSVQFSDGYRADLKSIYEICRRRDVLLFVDGIQSAGALKTEVGECCDFFVAGGQKHLLSPYGTGFLYVRKEVLPTLKPAFDGWLSHFITPEDFLDLLKHGLPPAPDARRFEVGTLPYGPLWGMDASISMLLEIRPDIIHNHNIGLADYFCELASKISGVTIRSIRNTSAKSHIVTIEVPNARAVADVLRANRTVVSVREGGLRFAFHMYNTASQIERALSLLERIIKGEIC